MSLDAWGRGEDRDVGRGKRLAGSGVAALVVVAAMLAVGIAFGGQIKKQVFEEEVDVKFVPPEAPKTPPPPPPPPPPAPVPKVASKSPPPLGAKVDAPPTEIPKAAPTEGDPNRPTAEGIGEGDPNGVVGGTGRGGGYVAPTATATTPPAPPAPVYQVAEVSTPPVPMAKSMPAYPDDARKQGIEAVVVVKFIVTETGAVEDIKIVKGHPMFDQLVLATVRSWTFQPGTLEGKPVRVARLVKIPFRLKAAN